VRRSSRLTPGWPSRAGITWGDELAQLGLVGAQLAVPDADMCSQAAQLGAQDLLGDRLAGMRCR
jgi:hypothetical protein